MIVCVCVFFNVLLGWHEIILIKLVSDVIFVQRIILILMLLWSCLEKVFPYFVIIYLYLYFIFWLFIYLAFPQIHPGITELDVEPYHEDEGTGNLRYVQVNHL